jgi:single-strand DNA-binding protein
MEINSVILTGRLTRDPEGKHTPSGTFVLKGSLATSRRVKQGDQWVDQASFFDFDYIGKGAEAVAKYLAKGKQIGIKGELKQERWEKDGQQKSKVVIFVESLMMFGSGEDKKSTQVKADGFQDDYPDGDVPF